VRTEPFSLGKKVCFRKENGAKKSLQIGGTCREFLYGCRLFLRKFRKPMLLDWAYLKMLYIRLASEMTMLMEVNQRLVSEPMPEFLALVLLGVTYT